MKPYKIIFIIFDGLGDRPIHELEGKTPLEAAKTPHLDQLVQLGINGLIHTIERNIRPGSDVAHLSLFGYDPRKYYRGRGPFEAYGIGMKLHKGDIAFRGNVATLDEKGIITDRRAGRIDNAAPLAQALDGLEIDGTTIRAMAGVDHRVAVVLNGPELSDQISDTDPHKVNEPIWQSTATNDSKEAKKTAEIVNKLTKQATEIFEKLDFNKVRIQNNLQPVNALLLRGAGEMTHFPSFNEQYGLNACCIAGGGLYKGIARMLGMEVLEVPGATGKPDTDIASKIRTFEKNVNNYDFFFIHFKGADTHAEDGKPRLKKEYIERADCELGPVVSLVEKNEAIAVVTGDHTTSSRLQAHTADEVPIVISGSDVRVDGVQKMGERFAQNGGLGHMDGRHLMRYIINLIGEEPLYGN